MKNSKNNEFKHGTGITSLVVISSVLTCGMMLPVWLLVGIIVLLVKLCTPKPVVVVPQYKTVYPSNEFADDWEYRMYDQPQDRSTDIDD